MCPTNEIASTGQLDWPKLFSFAVLRPEYFGALLFNPYIAAEEELDTLEARVAALCDGKHSVARIRETISEDFGLAPTESREHVSRILEKLARLCVLTFGRKESSSPIHPCPQVGSTDIPFLSAPKSVIWEVTYACNLKCSHCLTSSGKRRKNELETKEAFRLIDQLAEAKVFYLSLSGGEPLLRPDILDILQRIAATNLRADIATNGTIMNEELLSGLRELPVFQVQVSIDGIGEHHDRFRGRQGTFATACQTVEKLRDEGIAMSISTTVTRQNLDQLESIIQLAIDLGCSGYKAIPFIPAGRGLENADGLALDAETQCRFCRILLEAKKNFQGRINISSETSFAFLFEEVPSQNLERGLMACSAGHDTLSVGADGTAYPCPFFQNFPLGNLLEKSLRDIWCDSAMLQQLRSIDKRDMKGACRTCEYAPSFCRGGCRAAAYLQSGDILATDPNCFRSIMAKTSQK